MSASFLKGVTKVTDGQRWRDTWGEVWAGPQHRTFRHCCWVCSPCQSMAVFSSMFEENKTANLKKINPHLCSLDYLQIPKIWRQPKWPLIVAIQQQKVVSNCDFMDCSTLGSSFLHHLPEFAQTHVHWVSDTIQPSHPLLPASPPAFNFSQHQGLFQSVGSSHEVAKVLELQLQHQSFQWIFRLYSLQDWLIWSPCCPRDSQESSPTPQFKSINSSVLSFPYGLALTSIHNDYWKNHSFDDTDFCQ